MTDDRYQKPTSCSACGAPATPKHIVGAADDIMYVPTCSCTPALADNSPGDDGRPLGDLTSHIVQSVLDTDSVIHCKICGEELRAWLRTQVTALAESMVAPGRSARDKERAAAIAMGLLVDIYEIPPEVVHDTRGKPIAALYGRGGMKIVRLKNGHDEAEVAVKVTMASLSNLLTTDPVGFYELVALCRNRQHKLWAQCAERLRSLSLIETDGQPHDTIRNIVLSAAVGDGLVLSLVSPVA